MSVAAEIRALGLTPEQVREWNAQLVRDKSYELEPLGEDVKAYLRHKRKRLTDSSFREYESTLDKLARHVPYSLAQLEPPVGTQRIEEFMDDRWSDGAPASYNRHLSILRDFFRFQVLRGNMHGDPTLPIERAKKRDVYRTVFTPAQRQAILVENQELRDRVALRLLLDYALRKSALKGVQFKHFDHVRKRLTIFTKGGKVRPVPIPDPAFWHDLERLILDTEAQPHWFLLPTDRGNQHRQVLDHTSPKGDHGLHAWWYRCLARAGVVEEGTTSGERMHKARHSAGQRLLDHTGNLKAVQMLLMHSSISTTGDTYLGWDEAQLAASLESLLDAEEDES